MKLRQLESLLLMDARCKAWMVLFSCQIGELVILLVQTVYK